MKLKLKLAIFLMITSTVGVLTTVVLIWLMKYGDFKIMTFIQVIPAMAAGVIAAEMLGIFAVYGFLKRNDELNLLSKKLNDVTEELDRLPSKTSSQNYQMKSILSSIVNGVLAIDDEDRVLFINPAAVEIFNKDGFLYEDAYKNEYLQSFEGKSIDQLIEMLQINQSFIPILKNAEIRAYDIETDGDNQSYYTIYSDPLQGTGEVIGRIYVIVDMTEVKKSEIMRRDFVANVSHELKTPLTSIKGFVETLRDGAIDNPDVRDRFLGIIDIEATRLKLMIEDILTLSEIENKNSQDKINFNIAPIMNELGIMMNEIASIYKVKLIFGGIECDASSPSYFVDSYIIHGSPNWFKQMMINLIDNAIKYSSSVESPKVYVSCEKIENKLIIEVKDNGIGVPKESMGRLFEKFYRTDRARSRSVGGSGLGLAIVKHAVISFNGNISIESKVGEGTTFTVELPLREE